MILLDEVLSFKLLDNLNHSFNHNCIHDYRSAVQEYENLLVKDIWYKYLYRSEQIVIHLLLKKKRQQYTQNKIKENNFLNPKNK